MRFIGTDGRINTQTIKNILLRLRTLWAESRVDWSAQRKQIRDPFCADRHGRFGAEGREGFAEREENSLRNGRVSKCLLIFSAFFHPIATRDKQV